MTARCKGCTHTFSFSPKYEGPEVGDHLKLVVTKSSHLADSTGQDHAFRVHLLNTGRHVNTQIRAMPKHKLNRCFNTSRHTRRFMHANNVIELLLIPIICICRATITGSRRIVCINRCVIWSWITADEDRVQFETPLTDILIKLEP